MPSSTVRHIQLHEELGELGGKSDATPHNPKEREKDKRSLEFGNSLSAMS